jgi:hypothetical protein
MEVAHGTQERLDRVFTEFEIEWRLDKPPGYIEVDVRD